MTAVWGLCATLEEREYGETLLYPTWVRYGVGRGVVGGGRDGAAGS